VAALFAPFLSPVSDVRQDKASNGCACANKLLIKVKSLPLFYKFLQFLGNNSRVFSASSNHYNFLQHFHFMTNTIESIANQLEYFFKLACDEEAM